MKKYKVVIHCEGAWAYEVNAENSDSAKKIVKENFESFLKEYLLGNKKEVYVASCYEI